MITVTTPETAPALSYDRVFLQSLSIKQKIAAVDNEQAQYCIYLSFKFYAVADNKRYYKEEMETVKIDDYLTLAYEKAQTGDMDLLLAFQGIQNAVAILITDVKNINTTVS